MANELIANRNLAWIGELSELASVGDWQPDAPLSNLATPQLGEVARFVAADLGGICYFKLEFDSDQSVRLIGMLHAIFFGADSVQIELKDSVGDQIAYVTDLRVVSYIGKGDYVPVNFWHLFDQEYTNVRSIEIAIQGDGEVTPHHTIGGLWAGPAWMIDGLNPQFNLDVIDNSPMLTADANQTRANRLPRYRQMSVSLANLSQRTGLGISNDDLLVHQNSLLDLFLYSGNSSPVVIMPWADTPQLMHTLGIYGYLQGRLSLAGNTTGGEQTRKLHSAGLVVKESL